MPHIVFSPQILPKTVVDLARSMAPAGYDLTVADPGTAPFTEAIRDADYFLGAPTPEGREQMARLKSASARGYLHDLQRYRGPHGGRWGGQRVRP